MFLFFEDLFSLKVWCNVNLYHFMTASVTRLQPAAIKKNKNLRTSR